MTDPYRRRLGSNLLHLINDLKRNDAAAAAEMGLSLEKMRALLDGSAPLTDELIRRACTIWPLNERDLFGVRDDCQNDITIVRAAASHASTRVLHRGGRAYYEYRDTAMSRLAMFRPEWIGILQLVADDSPGNPLVEWNNGHLLHQFTYFVGPINYYYEWNGRRHCLPMTTGDSIWGLPFVPHTFTAREDTQPRFILALTYGAGLIGDAEHELSALGPERARRYALPVDSERLASSALLRLHMANAGLTVEQLAGMSGLSRQRVESWLAATSEPTEPELSVLAASLEVHRRELQPLTADFTGGVRLVRGVEAARWLYPSPADPDYRLARLAASRLHPFTRTLEVEVLREAGSRSGPAWLETCLHQYLYCLGPGPCRIEWRRAGRSDVWFDDTVEAGDSLYVKPFTAFRLSRAVAGHPATLVVLRIGGKTRFEAMTELGGMPPEAVTRVVAEDRQWYVSSPERATVSDAG